MFEQKKIQLLKIGRAHGMPNMSFSPVEFINCQTIIFFIDFQEL